MTVPSCLVDLIIIATCNSVYQFNTILHPFVSAPGGGCLLCPPLCVMAMMSDRQTLKASLSLVTFLLEILLFTD